MIMTLLRIITMRRAALTGLLWAAAAAPGTLAQPTPESPTGFFPGDSARAPLAQVTLIADRTVCSPGDTLWMALDFAIPDGWHLYWNGYNDSGLPPSLELSLPAGFTAGPLEWPHPQRKVTAGMLVDHVYTGRLVLPFPVVVSPGRQTPSTGKARIAGTVDWLICKEACIPEQAEVALVVHLSPEPVAPDGGDDAHAIHGALERVPEPAPEGLVQSTWNGGTITILVDSADRLEFYPHREGAMPLDLLDQGAADGNRLRLAFAENTLDRGVSGVLAVHTASETTWYHIEL